MYYIDSKDYRRLQGRAYRAQQKDLLEVCGIALVNSKGKVRLIFTKNSKSVPLTFKINNKSIKEVKAQIKNGEKIFGTFHSHPLSGAYPSEEDIKGAFYFRKAIIYDVCAKQIRLWYKPRKNKLKELTIKVRWK